MRSLPFWSAKRRKGAPLGHVARTARFFQLASRNRRRDAAGAAGAQQGAAVARLAEQIERRGAILIHAQQEAAAAAVIVETQAQDAVRQAAESGERGALFVNEQEGPGPQFVSDRRPCRSFGADEYPSDQQRQRRRRQLVSSAGWSAPGVPGARQWPRLAANPVHVASGVVPYFDYVRRPINYCIYGKQGRHGTKPPMVARSPCLGYNLVTCLRTIELGTRTLLKVIWRGLHENSVYASKLALAWRLDNLLRHGGGLRL